jgi:hypothetical protein
VIIIIVSEGGNITLPELIQKVFSYTVRSFIKAASSIIIVSK